jgi:NitT/TauT family transport system substrate-binding protein
MTAYRLKPAAKILIVLIVGGAAFAGYHFFLRDKLGQKGSTASTPTGTSGGGGSGGASPSGGSSGGGGKRTYRVALSAWPGHMPLVVANGGIKTQPGSAIAAEGLDLEVLFIEEPVPKNEALQSGQVDFVWQTVDELPLNMIGYKRSGVEARAFLQIDWSRGGDACIASAEVKKVEDILGRKSAMLKFSPDHTVFEFMLNNSRLTPPQVEQVRRDTSFDLSDYTYGRVLFVQNKVDVACLWEPDVSLALKARAGAHRLFSTADATELVADVLLARQDLLEKQPQIAEKLARAYFAGVKQASSDKAAAARLIASVVPRFRDELKEPGTLAALEWVKWTDLADNARFFGVDGSKPSFDRVYNQADGIWQSYPDAKITDRFAPAGLRNDAAIRKLWSAAQAPEKVVREEPKYEPKVAETGTPVFTKPVTINFSSGQAALDAESMQILNTQLVPQFEMARAMYIRVEGNTDNVGNPKINQALSEQRAKAVVDFLVSKGIDAQRISARGNGSNTPIASNKTSDGRATNRRTDILFISGAAANGGGG